MFFLVDKQLAKCGGRTIHTRPFFVRSLETGASDLDHVDTSLLPLSQQTGMPVPKSEFEQIHPCDFYRPAELLGPDQMYTVYEIARLLQGLDPDAELEADTEAILLDWAIPWIVYFSDQLVIAEPRSEDEPGYYGLDH